MPKATGASQQRISRVITTAGLRAAGLSAGQIGRLARDGTLQSLRTGVYAPTALVESLTRANGGSDLLQVAAALSVTGSRAVGSHHSAAAVHGLSLPGRLPPGRVELTRAPQDRGSRSRRPRILMHVADLPPDHVLAYRGVPFTSVARTVIDLARTLPFAEGVAVADSALRAEKTSKSQLDAVIASCARWPGLQRARRVVAFSDPRAESVLESISRAAFQEFGLPAPDLQVWVGDDGEVIGRVDFLWRQHRTIAEADGVVKYAQPNRALAQLHRDARLRAAGYQVVHFTWAEITRVPGQVVSSVRAAFRQSGAG